MGKVTVQRIGERNADDINLKNEPFALIGRLLPQYAEGKWSYTVERSESGRWDVFPDERYDFGAMKEDFVFFGAYDGSDCVGLAVLKRQWNRYLYLYDLKVNGAYRGRRRLRLCQGARVPRLVDDRAG